MEDEMTGRDAPIKKELDENLTMLGELEKHIQEMYIRLDIVLATENPIENICEGEMTVSNESIMRKVIDTKLRLITLLAMLCSV